LGFDEAGCLESYCAWTKGVATWLPRTDQVALVGPHADRPVFAQWERLAAAVGDMLQPTGMYPLRYKVCGFPDEKQLAEISRK
jgi:hypothetical protein